MSDDNSVLVAVGDSSDQIFTILPQCQILAITLIAIDCDVAFTAVGSDENEGHVLAACNVLCRVRISVTK